mmetsp:Transcript_79533/g.221287  ORF Transcript_79533/g.221287 Transcript_79533/m.221287 type:complete len:264 (-) Transcript_79533:111-902(-)
MTIAVTVALASGTAEQRGRAERFEGLAPSEPAFHLQQRVAHRFGIACPACALLSNATRTFESHEMFRSLNDLNVEDGAELTLVVGGPVVYEDVALGEDSSGEEDISNRITTRVSLHADGRCLFIVENDDHFESSSYDSGWAATDRWDVLSGTYCIEEGSGMVVCSWEHHFQRLIESRHWGSRQNASCKKDSGWEHMDQQASVKWQRLDPVGRGWNRLVEEVPTNGDRILGLRIDKPQSSSPDDNVFPAAGAEVLSLLGWTCVA